MNISEEGKSLIKKFEGCKLEAYYDAVDVLTIAYGRTKNVQAGDTCTQEQADAWLEEELKVLNENKLDEVPGQMRRWNKAGGKVLEGLERRRLAESMLFEDNPGWHEV